MTTYTTKDGDTVDGIAWRYYGADIAKATEQLLEANPGLAVARGRPASALFGRRCAHCGKTRGRRAGVNAPGGENPKGRSS